MAKWSDFETHPVGTADRIKELEARLAKAVEGLRGIIDAGGCFGTASYMENVDRIARTTLAELKGQDNE